MNFFKGALIIVFVLCGLIFTNVAGSAEHEKDLNLEAMTVTAQKTKENIQDVPISITVFDEIKLEDKMIGTISDIARFTPGLEIVNYGVALKYAPSIRGFYSDYGDRSSVAGLYIDGIPVTDGTGYDETLMDIERVEVLKGPQGTLYGKNTEVGVINIITKKPDNETRGKIQLSLGEDNKRELAFKASGAIIKNRLYIGASGKHYEKDGIVENYNTGDIEDDREHNYGKINLRWTPSDKLEFLFRISKIKYDDGSNRSGLTMDKPREVGNDLKGSNKSEVLLNALNISYNINDSLSLSSTTSYRKYNEISDNDFDYTNDPSKKFHSFNDSTYETISEELRLNFEKEKLKIVTGLFLDRDDTNISKNKDAWWTYQKGTEESTNDSFGVFSHVTYYFDKKFSVLGGIRYDKVNQEYNNFRETLSNDEDEISPKIGFTYKLKDSMMTYGTISKGYRSGGFNILIPEGYSKTFGKESLYSYEIGLKGSAFNGKISYDTAVYYMDISDMQVKIYIPSNAIKENAAKATSKGMEASLNFKVTKNIDLFSGISYNDTEYDKYNDGETDYSGKKTVYAPEYNFNFGFLFRSMAGYYASADITGYGEMYLDSGNKYKRDAYQLVNMKMGYEHDRYDIYFYAKNLFDEEYDMVGVQDGLYSIYSDPREIGVQLAFRW